MAAGSNNVSPMVRGFYFLAIKYQTSKEAKVLLWKQCPQFALSFTVYRFLAVFFKKIVKVYSQEIHVLLLSAYANILH
jgi:hypothetical protein